MTTIKRFTPDYKMHAVRFEAFAREAEHGEYVKFSDYEVLKDERDALEVRLRSALSSEQEAIQRAHAANQTSDALTVENACLVSAITDHKNSTHFCERCGEDDPCSTDDVCGVLRGIPDTDAALAAIQAQGVEKAAEYTAHESSRAEFINSDVSSAFAGLADDLLKLAAELREAK